MAMRFLASVPGILLATLWLAVVPTTAADPAPGPSFSCAKVVDGGIEQMICNDAGLSLLDRKLAAVYGEALKIAATQQPPTLVAENGDSVSLMYLQPSGSGARYAGRNESLWEHAGEATITWGYGAAPMTCARD